MGKGNSIITDLILNIYSNTAELKQGLAKVQNDLSSFTGGLTKVAGAIGVAFGAKEVLNFGLEVSQLAAKAQGVEAAFNKLPNSVNLLVNLKEATKGTVSELELMQKAVNFRNFNLPLEQMPKLLKFASVTAQQTGQDVNYLVDSIVTGLGRKSLPILDNLGLGSAEINEQLKKTPDFITAVGEIVDSRLSKMGDIQENNLTKTQRLAASFENLKVAIGKAANETGILGSAVDALGASVDVAASDNLTFWQKVLAFAGGAQGVISAKIADIALENVKARKEQEKHEQVVREIDRAYVEFNGDLEAYSKTIQNHIYKTELITEFTKRLSDAEQKRLAGIENIANLQKKQAELQALQLVQTGQELSLTNQELKLIDQKIKKLRELGTVEAENATHNKSKIPQSFQNYQKQLKEANSGTKQKGFTDDLMGADTAKLASKNIKEVETAAFNLGTTVEETSGLFQNLSDDTKQFIGGVAVGAFTTLGEVIGNVAAGVKFSLADMVKALILNIGKSLVALYAQAVAFQIVNGVKSGKNPILGLILAAAGVAALSAMWASKVPKFEKGGFHSGGWATVGEAGPELAYFGSSARIYSNKDSMRMFNNVPSMGDARLVAVVRNGDLHFALQEYDRRK